MKDIFVSVLGEGRQVCMLNVRTDRVRRKEKARAGGDRHADSAKV